jgi:hypothetical protein
MQVLGGLLEQYKEAIVRRWVDEVLATYPADAAESFRREQDQFANPVGHSVRVGVRGLVDGLTDGMDATGLRRCLTDIVKIRAVQAIPSPDALRFVFDLKHVVRAVLGEVADDPAVRVELAEFDRRVDELALLAFEIYVGQREQVYALRVNEARRRVAWVVEKLNQGGGEEESG